jgi:penicillin-binding protein 1B
VLLATVVVIAAAAAIFAARLSALRSLRASGPSWSFPSRVYADGLEFRNGRALPVDYLLAHLGARGYREVRGPAAAAGTFARSGDRFEIALREDPTASRPAAVEPERVRLTIRGGRLAETVRLRGAIGDRAPRLEPVAIALLAGDDRVWRVWAPLERVPQGVRDAIVAAEDRRFEHHMGIDLRAWARALFANVRAGQVREGGSTITQQLARGLFLGRDRNLGRKLAEVPLALGLELMLSKPRILEMYLNAVYWGQAGSWSVGGIEAAARWYYDAPVESLGVLQGATLAAIIPAPNLYDPFERPRLVRARRNEVLRDMVAAKRLDPARAAELSARPLDVRRGTTPLEPYPSYSGLVRDQLAAMVPPDAVTHDGLIVTTRMDVVWQQRAEAGLADAVASLDDGSAVTADGRVAALEGAFVALEPGSGAVLAVVGGRRPRLGGFNRAYQARRQTGSAIKPVVYAAALSTGHFTPASTVSDQQRTFQTDRGPWTPRNDDGTYHDEVTLVKALERSLNVATTNLVDAIGPQSVARAAERFGLGRLKPVMSIGLGSNEATLIDLTRAFAVFGDGGMLHPVTTIGAVADHGGHAVPVYAGSLVRGAARAASRPERATRVISEPVAALMTGLLTDVVRFGVAYPLRNVYGFTRPVAGKTGTTDDYRDAWFVGYTPDIVAGVWIGYDRPRSLGRLAVQTALPAWAMVVGPMLAGFPPTPFASDSRLEWHDLEPWSGTLASFGCSSQPVPFLPGTAPTKYCTPSQPIGPGLDHADSSVIGAARPRADARLATAAR